MKIIKYIVRSLLILLIVLIALGTAQIIVLIELGKIPENAPDQFVNQPGKKTVVLIGDSITQGTMGFNYVDPLMKDPALTDYAFVNAGINGDLAYNALQRTDRIIALNPAYIIILLGTNDANAGLNEENENFYIKQKGLPERPTKMWYEKQLTRLAQKLKEKTTAKIAIFSIPVIGEKLDSVEIQQTKEYSAVIKKIAEADGLRYLPLNEKQLAFLEEKNHQPGTLYGTGNQQFMMENAYLYYILHINWDTISTARGLLLTTDTIHQNSLTGNMIIEFIKAFLQE